MRAVEASSMEGKCFLGREVPKDLIAAHCWFNLAARARDWMRVSST